MSSASPPRVQHVGWNLAEEDALSHEMPCLGAKQQQEAQQQQRQKRSGQHNLPRRARSLLSLTIRSSMDSMQLDSGSARSSFDAVTARSSGASPASANSLLSMGADDASPRDAQKLVAAAAADPLLLEAQRAGAADADVDAPPAASGSPGIAIPYTREARAKLDAAERQGEAFDRSMELLAAVRAYFAEQAAARAFEAAPNGAPARHA